MNVRGPFLPMRSYEDEAQCDIHRSPSLLLKHYPIIYDDPVPDYAFLSSSQSGDAWYATVAVYGFAGDVAFVALRAASHDALAGPHGAWHGVLDAL